MEKLIRFKCKKSAIFFLFQDGNSVVGIGWSKDHFAEKLIQPFGKRCIDTDIQNNNSSKWTFRIGAKCALERIQSGSSFAHTARIRMLDDCGDRFSILVQKFRDKSERSRRIEDIVIR